MTEVSHQTEFLKSYLNEHLAGAVAGVELAEHLIERSEGPQKRALQEVLTQIEEDQEVLKLVLDRTGASSNPVKQATSWLGEKLSEFKFDRERSKYQAAGHVKELEALALGIAGKRSLWTLFSEVFEDDDRFEDVDFQRLIERAGQQYAEVDRLRLQNAQRVFNPKGRG